MTAASLVRALDIVGVFVFAVSGASLAARKRFDVVGLVVLAVATGLGGGIIRDVLLGATPPAAVRDDAYLLAAATAAAVVLVAHVAVERAGRAVLLFDAAGLGLFAVTGATLALDAGLAPVPSVVLGTTTAVGGGIVRDVLAREIPAVFRPDTALYAIPAATGALLTVVTVEVGAYGTPAAIGIVLSVFVLRVLAMRYQWRAPGPRGGTTG